VGQSVGAVAYLTIEQLAKRLARHEVSSRELVQQCLARIDVLNPSLNAFVNVAAEQALERAERADRERAKGRATGPLHGIPYAVKDVIATKGIPTTDGSRATRKRDDEDAEVVSRLNRAGAVLLGKLNLWEFAMVGSQFGTVRNPWNADYSAGGSSSGSAAAVAAGLVPLALGTDTGGSIRVPAAHCGVVGLRPTYGRISRDGVTPNAWSVDTVGPITRTAADAAIAFRALAGDQHVAAGNPPATNARRTQSARWRLGLVRSFFENTHRDVERAVTDALRELERGGSRLVDVDVPHANDAALARTLHLAEAAAFHGERLRDPASGIGQELRSRLLEAQAYPAVAYIKGLRLRTLLVEETRRAFQTCDLLVMPTDRGLPALASGDAVAATGRSGGPNTFLASMTGEPALAMPCGFSTTPPGLPISLMLQAPAHREDRLFAAAAALQRSTDWHDRRPAI
jgi:aspartyl-tRNA(Asn)/glutamyl-tRNA(Gln) amidotransferase subunit A